MNSDIGPRVDLTAGQYVERDVWIQRRRSLIDGGIRGVYSNHSGYAETDFDFMQKGVIGLASVDCFDEFYQLGMLGLSGLKKKSQVEKLKAMRKGTDVGVLAHLLYLRHCWETDATGIQMYSAIDHAVKDCLGSELFDEDVRSFCIFSVGYLNDDLQKLAMADLITFPTYQNK